LLLELLLAAAVNACRSDLDEVPAGSRLFTLQGGVQEYRL
jgi:hypothetical protein